MIEETVRKHRKHLPVLDPGFIPAALWNREYRALVEQQGGEPFALSLERSDGTRSTFRTRVLKYTEKNAPLNLKYLDRLLKTLLWQKGGYRVHLGGELAAVVELQRIYSLDGERGFDCQFMGETVSGKPFEIVICTFDQVPDSNERAQSLGGYLDGCRIGFDLGGSDRKCAAVIDGKVVYSEEVEWSPYFESDLEYHRAGIIASLEAAAAHLPRVDAIGGSAAGIYTNNEVRMGSLFRGIPQERFATEARPLFKELLGKWNVPFAIANDGDVTALAGSLATGDNAILGVAMGTSEAVGYVDAAGGMTSWLNELAFAPVDYRDDALVDDWSGDRGCGAQYFSQTGACRLGENAGISFAEGTGLPERLAEIQQLFRQGDNRARQVYETLGVWLGYTVAHYSEIYDLRHLLLLGRVTSGAGGELMQTGALGVLREEFPEVADSIQFRTPSEKEKRHGQAVAAASLPALEVLEPEA